MPDQDEKKPPEGSDELATLRAEIARLKSQRALLGALRDARDPDSAVCLAEHYFPDFAATDPDKAAKALREKHPWLFAAPAADGPGRKTGGQRETPPDALAAAAQKAQESGSRGDLVKYLEARATRRAS